jgi:hypothetical protein
MNYGKIVVKNEKSETRKISRLVDFVSYRQGDVSLVVPMSNEEVVAEA